MTVSSVPINERRLQLGEKLRRALNADMFVSYVCDADGPYSDPVQINLGQDGLNDYDQHFRHVDAITPRLFSKQRTSTLAIANFSPNEFVTDFLRPRDMYFGMNYFAAHNGPGSIDLRFWRGRHSQPFNAEETRFLHSFGSLISRLWDPPPSTSPKIFTPREAQIVELVADGWSDKQICTRLGVSLATLRTHIAHCFQKTGAQNRVGLANYYLRVRTETSHTARQQK
ncbi:response regulator transcription factor [Leucobacter coleopterorum]|uniref:Response regulator transcription factor n=1 Tax=Leucobacter coleopterorum TaxID=2714933 RepID=A0ABX6K159_9MICO|nr:LuxR C-terminal-related transcriptional regulator [Leucobacter coleopterorum]QIM18982.1 response regulator transcription factor [Leucobacter coleopterorum]